MTKSQESSSYDILSPLSFCVFDLETTGGNPQLDKIIEIGLVKIENLKIVNEKNFLIRPGVKIPEFIQKLTSITQDDVKDAPNIEDVIEEILEFMGDSILVAHNISFDVPFFNTVLEQLGYKKLSNKGICTNLMTRYLAPNLLSSNLNYMSNIFNIGHRKAHRALDDAYATAELLLKFLHIFIDKNIEKVNHLYYPRNKYELDRTHFKQKQHTSEDIGKKIKQIDIPFLVLSKGPNGVIQFVFPCSGKSSKEKDFIYSHLEKLNWETVTLKLTGPFTEAIIQSLDFFPRLKEKMKSEILNFLWKTHFQEKRPSEQDPLELFNEKKFPFIIMHHLVPEQLMIYPLFSLQHKTKLIFRYPGHRKKLLQYIRSKGKRPSYFKNDKTELEGLEEFLYSFINKSEKEHFIFDIPQNSPEQSHHLFKKLDSFLTKNPNPYNYPSHYI